MIPCCAMGVASEDSKVRWAHLHLATSPNFSAPGREGDEHALERLTPVVYDELRKAAKRHMARERDGHTLQTTALINEVYLRLVNLDHVSWQDRAHFFAICARLMRRILTDYARSRSYLKRGGDARRVTLDEALMVSANPSLDLVALEGALTKLGEVDSGKAA